MPVVLSDAIAERLKRQLDWFERNWRNDLAPPEGSSSTLPRLKIGQPTQNIASRATGPCNVFLGTPGSEKNLNLPSPIQVCNATSETITKGKWVGIVGQYIVVATSPARNVWGTWDGSQVSVTRYSAGDNPGSTLGGSSPNLPVAVDETAGTNGPKVGANIRCLWDDVKQQYWIVSWSC